MVLLIMMPINRQIGYAMKFCNFKKLLERYLEIDVAFNQRLLVVSQMYTHAIAINVKSKIKFYNNTFV